MTDRLQQIFENKSRSSYDFREVQRRHGLIPTPETMRADPLTREGAHELHKGIHWINLELSEFIGASPSEQLEELADVLHFIVEFCLLADLDHRLIPMTGVDDRIGWDRLDIMLQASENDAFVFTDAHTNARFAILASLKIAEMLKNKPWKQTIRTDLDQGEFQRRVSGIFYWYGAVVRTAGFNAQQLFDEFMRKEQINYQRIATGV